MGFSLALVQTLRDKCMMFFPGARASLPAKMKPLKPNTVRAGMPALPGLIYNVIRPQCDAHPRPGGLIMISKSTRIILCIFVAMLCAAMRAGAEDYPFRNPDLSIEERLDDLMGRLSLEEKIEFLTYSCQGVPRLDIPLYYHGNEALHGIVRPGKFTVFPQAIALSATWDPALITQITTAMSDEARGRNNEMGRLVTARSSGLLTFWSPTVNMARDPRWGRTPETYGEDPYLSSRIGVAFVRGLQGDDPRYIKAVSTPKHFVANNEEHNRLRCNAKISARVLREYYLPAFQACVQEGGAQSVMGAYNAVNDVPCNASKWLLTDVLRGDWGFDGYVVTDCGALDSMVREHKYAKSNLEAAAFGLNAGVDLECGGAEVLRNNLADAVKKGLVSEETVDRAAYRVLRGRFRLGEFDPPDMVPYNSISPDVIGSPEHQALALRAAQESMVLLKNSDVNGAPMLPLDKTQIKSIALVGPNADTCRFGDYSGSPINDPVSPLAGIRNRAGSGVTITHIQWIPPEQGTELTTVPAKNLRPAKGDGAGFTAQYFTNPNLDGAAETERIDAGIDIDTKNKPPDPAIPGGAFSVRWTGRLAPDVSGEYNFSILSEGAVRLHLGGDVLLQRKSKQKPSFKTGQALDFHVMEEYEDKRISAPVMLEAGREYEIRMEYRHREGSALARLEWTPPAADSTGLSESDLAALRDSDVVVAVMGIGLDQEREGRDRDNLELPFGQTDFVKQVLAANPRTVVALISGSPLSINWIHENAPAVIEAWYPGEQGGNALADVLFGNTTPAGRLPVTFYKSVQDLPPFDDYDVTKGRTYMYFEGEPLYPFGYGLSYTTFDYANLEIDNPAPGVGDTVTISVDVTNTGGRDGDEVVQLYVRDVEASVKTPNRKLAAFQRVTVPAGQTRTVSLPLAVDSLGFWSEEQHKFVVEPGAFDIMVGASSADIRLTGRIDVK